MNVPAVARRFTRRGSAGWTLRGRLLAATLAMLALICLIVGAITDMVVHRYLIGQLDSQLGQELRHGVSSQPFEPRPGTTPNSFLGAGAPLGAIGVISRDGSAQGAFIVSDYTVQRTLSPAATATLEKVPAAPPGSPATIHEVSLPGYGRYRAVATEKPDRDGSVVVIAALSLEEVNNTLFHLMVTELCVTVAGLIAVGLVGETIIRRTLRPLNRVAAIATRVTEMELGRGEVALKVRVPAADTDPRTEVGQVGASFNRMLGHVSNAFAVRQASEVRVRQFVADASHELRTPLAAIRGYAELTRRFDGDVPPDVAYAMRRVESESSRMTALVEDLLLLARLDAGRPLDHERVDLIALMVDVVSDAHVAGGDHLWRLDLPDEEVSICGDGARLHQILANLLTNARMHTRPGTTVTAALAQAPDGGATITVADNGPGIPAALLPEIFGRFARGDSSRSRAAGSTGLGLSIVAAVVAAHGGTVGVTSEPGATVFTVNLPPVPPPSEPDVAPDDEGWMPTGDAEADGPYVTDVDVVDGEIIEFDDADLEVPADQDRSVQRGRRR